MTRGSVVFGSEEGACKLLVVDTEEMGVHFIGSVVHIVKGLGNLAVQTPKLVITQGSAHAPNQRQNGPMRATS